MTARLAVYHQPPTCWTAASRADAELINAKLVNVEYGARLRAPNAMEIHSAAGLFTDRPVEAYLRDAFHIFAPAGTSDIQLLRARRGRAGHLEGLLVRGGSRRSPPPRRAEIRAELSGPRCEGFPWLAHPLFRADGSSLLSRPPLT